MKQSSVPSLIVHGGAPGQPRVFPWRAHRQYFANIASCARKTGRIPELLEDPRHHSVVWSLNPEKMVLRESSRAFRLLLAARPTVDGIMSTRDAGGKVTE